MNIYLFLPSNFVKRYTKIVNIHFYLCQTIYTIPPYQNFYTRRKNLKKNRKISKIKYKFIIYIYICIFRNEFSIEI